MNAIKFQLLRLLGATLCALPWQVDRWLFRLLYPLYYIGHRAEHARITAHLAQAAFRPSPPVAHIYENLFVNGMDSLRFLRGKSETQQRVHVANRALLQSALQAGHPVVAVSIHSGAFEMLHRTLANMGRPVHLIASDFPDAALTRYLRQLRATQQVKVYQPTEAPQVLRHLLRKKGVLALMLDQSRDPHGNVVELLGRPTRLFYRLPQEANKLGATIVTFRTMRRGSSHLVKFESAYPPGMTPQELERELTREVERWIVENPEQWAWNYAGHWNVNASKEPRANGGGRYRRRK